MPDFFYNRAGSVVAVPIGANACTATGENTPYRTPLPVFVYASVGGVQAVNSIQMVNTTINIKRGSRVQFMHTLRDLVHFYTFGEEMGELSLTGIAVGEVNCDRSGILGSATFAGTQAFYEKYRIENYASYIFINVDGLTFLSYLIGIDTGIPNAENGFAPYTLSFKFAPKADRSLIPSWLNSYVGTGGSFVPPDFSLTTTSTLTASGSTLT